MVTIHMVASLDGFIAKRDGSVGWLEAADTFAGGEELTPELVDEVLGSIDCYVMGARTYETAVAFEAQGLGWAYGDKPVMVLTHRVLERRRETVEFHAGDLAELMRERFLPRFGRIWVVGGGAVAAECLGRGLADEVRYSLMPVAIGEGISFFAGLTREVPLHLREVKAYANGMVGLRYEVKK